MRCLATVRYSILEIIELLRKKPSVRLNFGQIVIYEASLLAKKCFGIGGAAKLNRGTTKMSGFLADGPSSKMAPHPQL